MKQKNKKKSLKKQKIEKIEKISGLDNRLDNIVEKFHFKGVSYYKKFITPKNHKKPVGPYWYAYFKIHGKTKCRYVGKVLYEVRKM